MDACELGLGARWSSIELSVMTASNHDVMSPLTCENATPSATVDRGKELEVDADAERFKQLVRRQSDAFRGRRGGARPVVSVGGVVDTGLGA
jgi:hypothetical protein